MSLEFNTLVKKIFYNWHVKILSVSAAVLLFAFNRMVNLDENRLTVPLDIRLGEGMSISSPLPRDTVNVTIRGDKELQIGNIGENDIEVFADLSQLMVEDTFTIKLQYLKKGIAATLDPVSVFIDPQEMRISLEKTKQRSVPIEASIKAGPPDDYDYTYTITPSHTVITGPRSRVDLIEFVKTEGIDLSGKTENFSLPVKLVQPDSLVFVKDAGLAEFYCIINQVIVEKTLDARIRLVNLHPRLNILSALPSGGSLVLKISPQDLDSMDKDNVFLVLDCSNIKASGKYTIATKPVVPEGIVVVRYSPEEITIEVSGL